MKLKKAMLANALAIALAVTAVIPGGLTAEAAGRIVDKLEVERAEGDKAQGVTVDEWVPEFTPENDGDKEAYIFGSGSWLNINQDMKDPANAPAVILNKDVDVTYEAGKTKTIQVSLHPETGQVAELRFGIMLKYVDSTHWVFLNYDKGSWLLQYNYAATGTQTALSAYPAISEYASLGALVEGEDTLVKATYTSANQIDLSIKKGEADEVKAVLSDEKYSNILSLLENYAKTAVPEDGGEDAVAPSPIRYGFKAGSYANNATILYLQELEVTETTGEEDNQTSTTEDMETWEFLQTGKGEVFHMSHYGGDDYGSVDATEMDAESADPGVTVTDTTLTDFQMGTVSSVIRPATESIDFALNARVTYDPSAGSGDSEEQEEGADAGEQAGDAEETPAEKTDCVSLSYKKGETEDSGWSLKMGETVIKAELDPQFDLEMGKSYLVAMTFSEDNKVSAEITELAAKQPENQEQPAEQDDEQTTEPEATKLFTDVQVADTVGTGTISFYAAKDTALWVRNVAYSKITISEPKDLSDTYTGYTTDPGTVNTDNQYYKDLWEAYISAMNDAKTFLEGSEDLTSAEVTELLTALQNAKNGLQKTNKTNLQSKYDGLKDLKQEDVRATDESWTAFQAKLAAAKAVLDKIDKKEEVTSTEVSEQETSLDNAEDVLVERAATEEEKEASGLEEQIASVKDVKKEDKGYTEESWAAFESALSAAQAAMSSENTTNTQLQEALDNLKQAYEGLTPQAASSDEVAGLQALVNGKEGAAKQSDYPNAGKLWTDYTTALNAAKTVAANSAATQKEVNDALAALQNAYKALENYKASLPKTPTTLAAPTIKSATAKATKTGVDVEIVINPVSGADHYEVYKAGSKTPLATLKAGVTKYTDKNLTSANTSYSAVAVSKTGIKSAAGAAVKVTTAGTAKLAKVKKAGRKVRITWKKVKTAKQYMIYRSTKKNSGFKRVAVIKKNKVVSYVDKKAKKGKTNFYKLVVVDKSGVASVMSKAKKVKL